MDYILSQDKWTESEAVKYIKQLLEILRSTHATNVVHLDIKVGLKYIHVSHCTHSQ